MPFNLFSFFCILLSFIHVAFSCLANGVCGPGLGMCQPHVQSQTTCQSGCPPGYQCGPYGCTQIRARARSANLFQPNLETNTPDGLFTECCERRGLPNACLSKCTVQGYTKDALMNIYLNRDLCPISAVAEIQFCAGQGRDHRQCCARNGVGTTLAGEKCLVFCDQRPGNVTHLDYSYLSCYERFESIKNCFMHGMMEQNMMQRFLKKF